MTHSFVFLEKLRPRMRARMEYSVLRILRRDDRLPHLAMPCVLDLPRTAPATRHSSFR
jgi:hypothetical protein